MEIEVGVDVHSDGQLRPRWLDGLTAELAARQHGVVSRRQLMQIGFGCGAIDLRVRRGRLHQVYRGVYSVGHSLLSVDGRWMAAALAGGDGAVLSHRDAASAYGIRHDSRAVIELTVRGRPNRRRGLHIHHAELPADEVTTLRGIPVTTVPRTIFDLAAVLPRRHVERAIHEAEVRRLYDPLSLGDLTARHPGSRGVATLRAIVADATRGSGVTRQELEALFLDFVERVGLPRPELNRIVEVGDRSFECDCVWREQQLIVELDGRHVHGTPRNYESDRARDRLLTAHEWRVVRITWLQLQREPDEVARDLRAALAGAPR